MPPAAESRNGILQPALIAGLAGIALWFLAAVLTTKREPWDSNTYWVFVYPLALFACALLGRRFPDRPWRWALVLFEAQFLAMAVRNGELGNLWPIGMLMFAIVALPGMGIAQFAARRALTR